MGSVRCVLRIDLRVSIFCAHQLGGSIVSGSVFEHKEFRGKKSRGDGEKLTKGKVRLSLRGNFLAVRSVGLGNHLPQGQRWAPHYSMLPLGTLHHQPP